MMNNFRENDILILVGAGCSKEAGIPTSIDMVKEIEKFINDEWKDYKDLYYFLKSSILYANGLKGKYDEPLNIERLVNTLNELEKKEDHPIYPFIGSWNPKIIELCGNNFEKINGLKREIIKKLTNWVTLADYSKAEYYKKFFDFQQELQFPLRIFSLNYDLCLERNKSQENTMLELGFDERRQWQWQRFEKNENISVNIYLYKLHGSINWKRDENGFLTYSDEVSKIEQPDVIFGTNYKLQYVDPYLFCAYEFRKYSLEAKLIITIGYGYADEHINGIISQALRNNENTKLIANLYNQETQEESIKNNIKNKLYGVNDEKLIIKNKKASEFLKDDFKLEKLNEYLPKRDIEDYKGKN